MSTTSTTMFVVLLAAVLLPTLGNATPSQRGQRLSTGMKPRPDTLYDEMVAERMQHENASTVIATWPTLPFNRSHNAVVVTNTNASLLCVESTPLGDSAVLAASVPSKLFLIQAGSADSNNTEISSMEGPDMSNMHVISASVSQSDAATVDALVAHSKGLTLLQCKIPSADVKSQTSSKVSCTASETIDVSFGLPTAHCFRNEDSVMVGTETSLWRCDGLSKGGSCHAVTRGEGVLSMACLPNGHLLVGNNMTVTEYDKDDSQLRSEWVSDLESYAGGVYDGPPLSMAINGSDVYMATTAYVNMRPVNDDRVDRIGFRAGLPMNDTAAVAIEPTTGALWVGGLRGVARHVSGNGWQYMAGNRYLPGTGLTSVHQIVCLSERVVLALCKEGVSVLRRQQWTLARKAAHMETILMRHNRHGQVSECSLPSYGDTSSCQNHDSDNNGLWTSLVVGGLSFKFALYPTEENEKLLHTFFEGMKLLCDVTGIRGLMARSAVSPDETHGAGGTWHNSTVPGYKGWQWKGDTSSDEVVGHYFAYTIMQEVLPVSNDTKAALSLMEDIIAYIIDNKFYLIDVTGKPTTWGRWAPADLNDNRQYSDERGLNSMQILAYLTATLRYTQDANLKKKITGAIGELTNATNQYNDNIVNLKIETPVDDNYSDDELAFLPYYVLFRGLEAWDKLTPYANASFDRSFDFVRRWRSNLWNGIYIASGGRYFDDADIDNIIWNLQTWPLDLIDWPVENSVRYDVQIDPTTDRSGRRGTESVRVLPANERAQYRWNSNPHDMDGGSGGSEFDPGAWLLPYWLARYAGILDAPKA